MELRLREETAQSDVEQLVEQIRLQNWANYRFKGGGDALPDGLKS